MPLAIQFAKSGHDVLVIKKSPTHAPHPRIKILATDITTLTSDQLPKQIDKAFYLLSAASYTQADYEHAYLHGLSHFCATIQPALDGPAFFTSSTSVYGQQDGSWVDENSPTTPLHFSGRIMLEAEQRFSQYSNKHCSIRLSGIYGPGRCRIIDSVKALSPPPHNLYTNRIHQVDAVNALIHLSELTELAPTYIVTDNTPTSYAPIYQFTQQLLGLPPASFTTNATHPTSRGGNKRLLNTRLRKTGFICTYPSYKEGIEAIVQSTRPPYLQPQ